MEVLYFSLGIICGVVITLILSQNKTKPVGNLILYKSEPNENPDLFLEVKTDMRNIYGQKQVLVNIKHEDYISQK